MISIEELRHRCDWVMKRNVRCLLEDGRTDPDFYFGKGEGSLLYWMRFTQIGWMMNDGDLKRGLFSIVRISAESAGYDCVIFSNDMWTLRARGPVPGTLTIDEAEARGYGKKVECVGVIGQTPLHVVGMRTVYYRDALNPDRVFKTDPPEPSFSGSIDTFAGRSKMFGDWKEPGMRKTYQMLRRSVLAETGARGLTLPECTTLVNIELDEP